MAITCTGRGRAARNPSVCGSSVPDREIAPGHRSGLIASGAEIVTAGAKQKAGQSRMDLAGANVGILRKLIPPLHGALLKNEQDVHLFERLAFLNRRERAT